MSLKVALPPRLCKQIRTPELILFIHDCYSLKTLMFIYTQNLIVYIQ